SGARAVRGAAAVLPKLAPDGHAGGWMFGGGWRAGLQGAVGSRDANRSAGGVRATVGRIRHSVEGLSLAVPGRFEGAQRAWLSTDSQHAWLRDRFQLSHFRGVPHKDSGSQHAP